MEKVTVNGELLFVLHSNSDWVNRVPRILPEKTRAKETWLWVDKNGNVFEMGLDFMPAQKADSYPCKVYRLQNVASAPADAETTDPTANLPEKDRQFIDKMIAELREAGYSYDDMGSIFREAGRKYQDYKSRMEKIGVKGRKKAQS